MLVHSQIDSFKIRFEIHPKGYYSVGEYIDANAVNNLRLMHYDVYYDYAVAYSYRTWPFRTAFDLHVLHVFESGIQKYWELMVVYYLLNLIEFFKNISTVHIYISRQWLDTVI